MVSCVPDTKPSGQSLVAQPGGAQLALKWPPSGDSVLSAAVVHQAQGVAHSRAQSWELVGGLSAGREERPGGGHAGFLSFTPSVASWPASALCICLLVLGKLGGFSAGKTDLDGAKASREGAAETGVGPALHLGSPGSLPRFPEGGR